RSASGRRASIILTDPPALPSPRPVDDRAPGSSMPSEIEVRACTAADWPAFTDALTVGFGNVMPPEARANSAALIDASRLLVATDQEAIVGTAGLIDFEMTVPGGEIPTAGIT